MQFLDCKITLSFSNQKIKDRSGTLINKGIYEVELKFIASLILPEWESAVENPETQDSVDTSHEFLISQL
ncbi:MAG: hypothetical protein J5965_18700, partial [Aeriscardovia sp.]|nr:hypothetical protein [Aeriscardovia sp.]